MEPDADPPPDRPDQSNALKILSVTFDKPWDARGDRTGVRRVSWLIFLAYLPFYFVAWLFRHPGVVELAASFAGLALFLGLVAFIWWRNKPTGLWEVLTMFAIGLALSRFNTGWTVYTIFAMSFAARLAPRRRAVIMLLTLEVVLLAMWPLLPKYAWPIWLSGMIFGGITGFASLTQADIMRKNDELAQAHDEVRALAATAERERISRDLHDLLGHTLTLVAVKAELAARLVGRDAAAAEREMQAVATAARDALTEVRTAVTGMRGASLAGEAERARQALASANILVEASLEPIHGDPRWEAVFAMALREAVTNVIRHASARRCVITLETHGPTIRLRVDDDGLGGKLDEGNGLKGMRARLAAIGGGLEITSDPGGTRLLASAPVQALS
jgi:two-component system sensor histidine kinase DesK